METRLRYLHRAASVLQLPLTDDGLVWVLSKQLALHSSSRRVRLTAPGPAAAGGDSYRSRPASRDGETHADLGWWGPECPLSIRVTTMFLSPWTPIFSWHLAKRVPVLGVRVGRREVRCFHQRWGLPGAWGPCFQGFCVAPGQLVTVANSPGQTRRRSPWTHPGTSPASGLDVGACDTFRAPRSSLASQLSPAIRTLGVRAPGCLPEAL